MSAKEIIELIKALPIGERAEVAKFVVEQDDSWIPDDFNAAMNDAQQGRLVDMDKSWDGSDHDELAPATRVL